LIVLDQINYLKSHGRAEVADDLIKQAQNVDRNFTYYVYWPKSRKTLIPRKWSKKREYVVSFNVERDATNIQTMKAYFFGLKLDEILNSKLDQRLPPHARLAIHILTAEEKIMRDDCLREAIEETEEYYELFEFDAFIAQVVSKGWRLETIYIDKGTNRYRIE
jgi:hypothetical protein